jgi:hypothetical protein
MLGNRLQNQSVSGNPFQDVPINKKEDNNADRRWSWSQFRHMPQPIDPANIRENNPMDDNGPEEEAEEVPVHPHRR